MDKIRTTIGNPLDDGGEAFGVTIQWDGTMILISVDGYEDRNGCPLIYVSAWDGAPELVCNPDVNAEEPLTIHFHEAASPLRRNDGDGSSHWDEVRKVIEQHNTYNHLKED